MQRRDIEKLDGAWCIGETAKRRFRIERLPVEHAMIEARQQEDAESRYPAQVAARGQKAQAGGRSEADKCGVDRVSSEGDDVVTCHALRCFKSETGKVLKARRRPVG